MEQLTLFALVALILATVIKEVASYLKQKALLKDETRVAAMESNIIELKTSLASLKTTIDSTSKDTKEMYDWHDKSDEDGVKIWYIRKSLENVLRENAMATAVLAKNSELQTSLLKELIESQRIIMKEQMILSQELKYRQQK